MQRDPRPQISRRRAAVRRLRSLTTGSAIVGIAGTAAFGAVAAASWSGDPSATPLPDSAGASGSNGGGPTPAGPTRNQVQPAPNGGFAQPPVVTTPRTSRGSGHASTGGSG